MTALSPPGDLLARVAAQSLDDDYAAVAARRTADATAGQAGAAAARRVTGLTFGGAVAVLAVLLTISALETRDAASQAEADRLALIDRIEAEQIDVAELRDAAGAVQGSVDDLRNAAIEIVGEEAVLDDVLTRLEAATGAVPVSGPGLRIMIDDAPGARPEGLVRDTDLQLLANGLWEAGAQAVAVGGQRLTTRSAIRTAGQAITVNYRSLSPPYVVTALGDPDTLAAEFLETPAAQSFVDLQSNLGVRFEVASVDSLTLAGRPLSIDQADQIDEGLP